jgi:hypothetical protein
MSDDQFEKLANMLNKRFEQQDKKLDERFEEQDARLDKRFNEQDERLDSRFQEQDEKFGRRFQEQDAKMDQRFNEQDEKFGVQFAKPYQHVEHRSDEHGQRMDRIESRMSSLEGGIDRVLKNQETDHQERLAANHQLDRHEDWIERAADVINVSYDPAA